MDATRDDLFAATQCPPAFEAVDVPQLGKRVYVRKITATERDALEAANVKFSASGKPTPNTVGQRGRLAARVICDATGKRLFTDSNASQLGDMPADILDVILDAATRLNGMTREAEEEAKGN